MTYLEVLKLLKKHRIVVVSNILKKWESVLEERNCGEKNILSEKCPEDIQFSFYLSKNIELSEFEELGITVKMHFEQCFCSIKYLQSVLARFSNRIMLIHSPQHRIPSSLLEYYLMTIENLVNSLPRNTDRYAYILNGEAGLEKHSYFAYKYIYEDLEWNIDLVERFKDVINWKQLIEKSNILWTEDMIIRYLSYIPFCVGGDTYCDKFNRDLVIQDFSRIDFLSNTFIDYYKERLDFHEFLSSAKFEWDSAHIASFYKWAINIKTPHSSSFPKTMEGSQFKYGHGFFGYLVSNPNFVWNANLLLAAIELDSTMLDVFVGVSGKEKEKIRRIIEEIPNYQNIINGMKEGQTFFMRLEDEDIMPFDSYSTNFNLDNIKRNIILWNEVLTDKFVHIHRLSRDTYYYVNQVRTMWNYYEENPNVTLTYEICEYLEDKNICIGGEYEKEYDNQDYLDAGFYTKEINALSYFAHKPLKGKEELKKIYSNPILFENLLVGGNSDLIEDILDIMIKEYGIDKLVTYVLDDNCFEKEFGNG